ncbi:MAG TPA: hypothetical protein VLG40_02095 [Candidatus Saccharimonas sp.]|nr:hypothetical protein [Candidatus Saccharimonas sp.]
MLSTAAARNTVTFNGVKHFIVASFDSAIVSGDKLLLLARRNDTGRTISLEPYIKRGGCVSPLDTAKLPLHKALGDFPNAKSRLFSGLVNFVRNEPAADRHKAAAKLTVLLWPLDVPAQLLESMIDYIGEANSRSGTIGRSCGIMRLCMANWPNDAAQRRFADEFSDVLFRSAMLRERAVAS